MTSGISAQFGNATMRSAATKPSISGIWASISTRSQGEPASAPCAIMVRAAIPDSNSITWAPTLLKIRTKIRRFTTLSSTTTTRKPASCDTSAGNSAVSVSGSRRITKWNSLPCPTSLSTHKRPARASTRRLEMVKPRPVPPNLRVVELSSCENASKIEASLDSGMPMPVSLMVNWMACCPLPPDARSTCKTTSPCSVNLIALPIRFIRI